MSRTASGTGPPAAGQPSQLTLALLLGGAFCCPMSTWTLFKGYLLISDALFLAALATHALRMLQDLSRLATIPFSLLAAGMGFALSGLITFALGDDANADPINAAKMVFSLTVFPILIMMTTGGHTGRINALLAAWLAGGAFSAAVAVASHYGVALLGFYDGGHANRASGLGYHPNALGYTSALLAPVAIYFWWRATARWQSVLMLAGLCVLLYALHLSGSRAALVALLLALAFPVARLIRIEAAAYALVGALGLAFVVLLGFALASEFDLHDLVHRVEDSAIGRLLGLSGSGEHSDSERRAFLRYSWAQFQESPLLGSGYGWLRGAHMHVLGIMHSGGLLGLSALLLWFTALATAGHRTANVQHRYTGELAGLRTLVVAGLVIWFVNGGLQPVLLDRNGYILAGVLFALAAHTAGKPGIPGSAASYAGIPKPATEANSRSAWLTRDSGGEAIARRPSHRSNE